MSQGTNKNGGLVSVNDSVSIVAKVVSVSGSSSLAQITCQAPFDAGTFVAQANDCNAVLHGADASHVARSITGQATGAAYDDITVMGVVTSIAGSGQNAILSVILKSSRATINTAAGNCSSAA